MWKVWLSIMLWVLSIGSVEAGVSPVSAEWVRVGGTHKYDRYVDMRTIGMSESQATLWTLRNFHVERAILHGPYRSIRIKRQYAFRQKKSRPLHIRYYQRPMAQGRILYAAQATREWSRVIPGSDDDAEMKIVCRSTQSAGSR